MKCFRNLKMKWQIIIFNILIMSVIVLAIIGIYFIQQRILFHIIQSSTERITLMQEKRQLKIASLKIQDFLEQKYDRSILNVQHIQEFFLYSQENKERYTVSDQLFQPCVKYEDISNDVITFNSNLFCYQTFLNEDGITQIFNQTGALLSQFSLLFDVTPEVQLVFGNLPDANFMISYPRMYQLTNFSVKTRPWFISYQSMYETNPDEQYYYTPIYLSLFVQEYMRALVATLYDPQGQVIGYTRQTILFSDNQLAQIPIYTLLVNNDGSIVFSSFLKDQQSYIYNQSITGLNQTDWEAIQQYTNNNNQSDQLCDGYQNTFCLFNKLNNAQVQLEALQFKKEQLSLLIFTNVSFYAELDQKFNNLTNALLSLFLYVEVIIISVCLLILILTGVFVHFLFVPLFQLMTNVQQHIKTMGNNVNKEIFKLLQTRSRKTNVFTKLNVRFMTIHDLINKSQNQKSKLCLQIEQMQYNIKASDLDYSEILKSVAKLDSSPIKNQNKHRQKDTACFQFIKKTLQEQHCNNHLKD